MNASLRFLDGYLFFRFKSQDKYHRQRPKLVNKMFSSKLYFFIKKACFFSLVICKNTATHPTTSKFLIRHSSTVQMKTYKQQIAIIGLLNTREVGSICESFYCYREGCQANLQGA